MILSDHKLLVDFRAAFKLHAAYQQAAIGLIGNGGLKRIPNAIDGLADAGGIFQPNRNNSPAHDVTVQYRKIDKFTVFHRDEAGTFGTSLADVPSLQVTGKDYMWPLMKHLGLMHMAKRPVVVPLVHEIIERAWRVVLMAAHATKPGVQDADVEGTGNRFRIRQRQIVGNIALSEALSVQGNVQLMELEGLRLPGPEDIHILR